MFLLTVPRRYFFCGSFALYLSCICHALGSVHCCLVVTYWERADLLAPVFDVNCVFVTFRCGILGQVWCLIVSIPDLCPLYYFHNFSMCRFTGMFLVENNTYTFLQGGHSLQGSCFIMVFVHFPIYLQVPLKNRIS